MKTKIEDWDESFLDLEDYQVERALTNAALDAIYRARRFGTDYVIEEEGRAKSLGPNETEPYEKRLLEKLEKLNRKINEIAAQTSNPLSLNEKPDR
jgi:molybdenum-dependent DNA-binding transcriptional regulator ModE